MNINRLDRLNKKSPLTTLASWEVKHIFGGQHLKNSHAKTQRPLNLKKKMLIQFECKQSEQNLNSKKISTLIEETTQKLARKVQLNLSAIHITKNKIQIIVKLKKKSQYLQFIRALSGSLALQISGANKFKPLKEKFWQQRPWTCILENEHFSLRASFRFTQNLFNKSLFKKRRPAHSLPGP